jgi:hypothetical protein
VIHPGPVWRFDQKVVWFAGQGEVIDVGESAVAPVYFGVMDEECRAARRSWTIPPEGAHGGCRRSSHDGLVELLDTLPAEDQATHSLAMRRPQRY